ncbi:hypothetical protein [Paenibacillus xylanexedens]|uniref:hypothetical protein n=1 Tax=Paenibacillus xylanexedens TaxID=528191 RepID=UPI00119EECFE|nr:hypothetical protein [Paenibacillus xylanexedens]
MKKILIISMALLLSVIFAGCSGGSKVDDNLTMEKFTKAFTDAGAEKKEEKPMFSMIKAKDGEMLYLKNNPVKLYEFNDPSEIKDIKKEFKQMEDWPVRGNFMLESSNAEAREIFAKVE